MSPHAQHLQWHAILAEAQGFQHFAAAIKQELWREIRRPAKATEADFPARPPRPPSESIQRTRQARKDSHNPFFAD